MKLLCHIKEPDLIQDFHMFQSYVFNYQSLVMAFLPCDSPVSATLKVILTLENTTQILKSPDPIYRRKITSVPNLGTLDKVSNKPSRLLHSDPSHLENDQFTAWPEQWLS